MSKVKEGASKSLPNDDASFMQYVRSLNRRIARLRDHLLVPQNTHDYRARQRLEMLLDKRGYALTETPTGVTLETVNRLKEEIREQS